MTNYEERLLRKQARLIQKLERVKAKLANRALHAKNRRGRAPHNPYVSTLRVIVSTAAFGVFWWLGRSRLNSFIDELFGDAHATPKQTAAPESTHETFWTFGRRRRTGQEKIRPVE